ncbi:MAG: AI-2E family transporter [Chloroflexota bacterium]
MKGRPQIASELLKAFEQLGDWLAERGFEIGPSEDITDRVGGAVSEAYPALLEYAPSAFSSLTGLVGGTFVALFILYYVLLDWDSMVSWVGSNLQVPAGQGAGIVEDATHSFREYFYVLTASSFPVAVMVGVAAAVLSVPLAFTIALVSLVTSYIPFVGMFISALFALLVAFGSGGIVPALLMLVVIIVAQGLVQPLIQARMQRDTLDIYPVVGFGATVVGTVLAGFLGATLSAPVVAMILRVRKRIRAYERGEDPLAADAAAPGSDPEPNHAAQDSE